MTINAAGLALIKEFEGCKLVAYPDPGTGGDPWTIGVGHTGDDVYEGLEITQEQADALLAQDLSRFEAGVSQLVTAPIGENQFSALVAFTYNVGLGNLKSSLLLRCVNMSNHPDAAAQFLRWNRAAGKVMAGLTRRRQAESDLYSLDIPT